MWKPEVKNRKKPRSSVVSVENRNVGIMHGLLFFLPGFWGGGGVWLGVFVWFWFDLVFQVLLKGNVMECGGGKKNVGPLSNGNMVY